MMDKMHSHFIVNFYVFACSSIKYFFSGDWLRDAHKEMN